MSSSSPKRFIIPVALISAVSIVYLLNDSANFIEIKPNNKVWLSMSVCWSRTVQVREKKHFPYLESAVLAAKLWKNFTSDDDIDVIVQIIHQERGPNGALEAYKGRLLEAGAQVAVHRVSDECVLHSQLQRMFAFTLPFVSESDLIISSDVDVFPMVRNVFKDLSRREKGVKVWIYQYWDTVRTGFTFALSFIAMSAGLWRRSLDADSPQQLLEKNRAFLSEKSGNKWGFDQLLISRGILKSGICRLPEDNPLWIDVGIDPNEVDLVKEGRDCFYGTDSYQTCTRDRREDKAEKEGKKCRLWHFHPYERLTEIQSKYEEILYGKGPKVGLSRQAESVKIELQRILGLRN